MRERHLTRAKHEGMAVQGQSLVPRKPSSSVPLQAVTVERLGRRILLLSGYAICASACLVLTVALLLQVCSHALPGVGEAGVGGSRPNCVDGSQSSPAASFCGQLPQKNSFPMGSP